MLVGLQALAGFTFVGYSFNNCSRGSMSKGMKAIHIRIVVGAVILLLAAAAWFYQTTFFSRT